MAQNSSEIIVKIVVKRNHRKTLNKGLATLTGSYLKNPLSASKFGLQ